MWNGVNVMTDEQWKEVEKKLVPPFGRAELEIDGYKVVIVAGLVDKMKYGFVVYVNGFIRAEWSMNDCEIRRRFYYESKKSLLKSSEKSQNQKDEKISPGRNHEISAILGFPALLGQFLPA